MMRSIIRTILVVLLAAAGAAEGQTTDARGGKTYVVVFDFACQDARLGEQLADSVRLKLRRHEDYDVLDYLTTREASGPLEATADQSKVIALMTNQLGVNLALYGTVVKSGDAVRAQVVCIDLSEAAKPRTWQKVFVDDTERARGVISTQIVETIRGQDEWRPPEYGDEAEPKDFGKPLNVNGDFERGRSGWEHPDNVSTFLEPGPAGRGGVLRIRTDLQRDAWLEYQRKIRLGQADPSKPPEIAGDTSYGSVAGLEGVHYRSEWIRATPGHRYWLAADMKGPTAGIFFPKIFVKGYSDWSGAADGLPEVSLVEMNLTPESFAKLPPARRSKLIAADVRKHPERYRRECYRWYLACRNEENEWKHYAAPFPPRGGLPKNVQWFQINVYAYWPPGEYLFDNVHMYKDPRQTRPLPEVDARTPTFDQTREKMEKARTRPSK